MRRVYQRFAALAAVSALGPAGIGCGRGAEPRPDPPPAAARRPSFDQLLAGSSYELPELACPDSPQIATKQGPAGVRAVALAGTPDARMRALTAPDLDCRAVACQPVRGERAVVECADRGSGPARLLLVDVRTGARLAEFGSGDEEFLAWSSGDGTLWTATRPSPGAPARLLATSPALARRSVAAAPAGYVFLTAAPDAGLALLRREIGDEADEILLHDWRHATSRLLLPTGADGRFFAARLVDGSDAALLLADDGRDLARLERLDLATGTRIAWGGRMPCPPFRLRVDDRGAATVLMACDGRPSALRLAPGGETIELPAVASGTRVIDALPVGDDGSLLLLTAGERWPADVGRSAANGDFRPLAYGLDGRVTPAGVPAPRAARWSSGGLELPAELWPAAESPAKAVVVWFEPADRAPRFGVHRPLAAALAVRGVATLVVHGRGDAWPSRRLRRAADGDPFLAARQDLRAAAAAVATPGPRLLVGEGAWWGAAALAEAAAPDSPYAAVFALFPDPDPLAPLAAALAATPERRDAALERWGARDAAALATLATDWRFPVERVRRPVWLALDRRSASSADLLARVAAAASAGAPVEAIRGAPRPWGDRLPGELERALAERLLATARDAPR